MFLVVFGDIHIDNLQNIFRYATMDTIKNNEKNIRKTTKKIIYKIFQQISIFNWVLIKSIISNLLK